MQHKMEEQRMQEQREHAASSRSNKNSMPYNPINLRYDDRYALDALFYCKYCSIKKMLVESEWGGLRARVDEDVQAY